MQRAHRLAPNCDGELIHLPLGSQEARIFLVRLGYLSGRADARFLRTNWPGSISPTPTRRGRDCTCSAASCASNRSTTSSTSAKNDRRGVQLARQRRGRRVPPPSPAGDGSRFAGRRSVTPRAVPANSSTRWSSHKEVQCSAEGHLHCRVVGKPADVWGLGDPEVILFRERIATPLEEEQVKPRRALTVGPPGAHCPSSTVSSLPRSGRSLIDSPLWRCLF